uniref:Uncharacterized protein n=1 Tax=Myotis myotis TaxID=51298 RepID=A0A7J7XZK9_MYOMY|nr:hypothetical protein mMyoMyo1_011383 [Myotis myotis]
MLLCFMLSQISLRLSYCSLIFSPTAVQIGCVCLSALASNSLIQSSASSNLLLKPSILFFNGSYIIFYFLLILTFLLIFSSIWFMSCMTLTLNSFSYILPLTYCMLLFNLVHFLVIPPFHSLGVVFFLSSHFCCLFLALGTLIGV